MVKICLTCNQEFSPCKKTSTTCSRYCANVMVSRRSANARGDKLRGTGENKTYRKRNGVHEHRLVMTKHLGRELRSDEIVHHKDNNRYNNSIDNLEIMKQSEHARLHSTKNRVCTVDKCNNKHSGLGYCSKHYQRFRNNGNVD